MGAGVVIIIVKLLLVLGIHSSENMTKGRFCINLHN